MTPSKYGICYQCHSPINIPGLAAFKCSQSGWKKTNDLKSESQKIKVNRQRKTLNRVPVSSQENSQTS
ncbi:hypothetical protein MiSe_44420 [Microseira wollei NIES-4236]|uniref:Transposase n=1 Tax=Microseira wollei NIES-4236 TaxID=2530354 RepID=A0AAV3XG32_9CYAN|nr:hypothetical protein MiSe_44420 [Microseira wollei NIES-4236]